MCELLIWQQDDCDGFLKGNNFVEVDEFVHKISMGGAMVREQKEHIETGVWVLWRHRRFIKYIQTSE